MLTYCLRSGQALFQIIKHITVIMEIPYIKNYFKSPFIAYPCEISCLIIGSRRVNSEKEILKLPLVRCKHE